MQHAGPTPTAGVASKAGPLQPVPFVLLQARLLLKQTTDYNIKVARFSAFEEDHFMTAGRDSIRCYRLKQGGLRGMSVHMQVCRGTGYHIGLSDASCSMPAVMQ